MVAVVVGKGTAARPVQPQQALLVRLGEARPLAGNCRGRPPPDFPRPPPAPRQQPPRARVARLRALPAEEGMFEDVFTRELARKLPAFLESLADIRRSSSESLAQVKQQQTAFTAFTRAVTPFRQL